MPILHRQMSDGEYLQSHNVFYDYANDLYPILGRIKLITWFSSPPDTVKGTDSIHFYILI